MIITCPNCQTCYQVAENAIGSAGRKVQCANCAQSWQAVPEPEAPKPKPKLVKTEDKPATKDQAEDFSDDDEDKADAAFEAADKKTSKKNDADKADKDTNDGEAAEETTDDDESAGKAEPALQRNRLRAMRERQKLFASKLPVGRIRRMARVVGIGLLVAVIAGGVYFRTGIVRFAPDLAGIYDSVGLGVNVVGLEFKNARTLRSIDDGSDIMMVTARIQNVTNRSVKIPPVVVTIVDGGGASIYQWSTMPPAQVIGPGEVVDFETQLSAPPEGATNVQLAFDNSGTN